MVIVLLLLLILLSMCVGFYQFVKQQGRVLLRLDALEHSANGAVYGFTPDQRSLSAPTAAAEPDHDRRRLTNERPLAESHIERDGLRAGTPAPGFDLPDLLGHTISLDDYRGRRVLLVFSDPNCGPCDALAPDLVRLHQQQKKERAIILVGRGSIEENRSKAAQFGFEFPVVLQDKWKLSKAYGIFATPVAFLIDEDGVIVTDVAAGKEAILALAGDDEPSEQSETYRELAFDQVSRAVASPVSRRKMLGTVGAVVGGAVLAALGLQRTASGQAKPDWGIRPCPWGTSRCGDKCCGHGQICCGGKCCNSPRALCLRGECCESRIVCAGKCCKEDEHCFKGCCRKVISPNEL